SYLGLANRKRLGKLQRLAASHVFPHGIRCGTTGNCLRVPNESFLVEEMDKGIEVLPSPASTQDSLPSDDLLGHLHHYPRGLGLCLWCAEQSLPHVRRHRTYLSY